MTEREYFDFCWERYVRVREWRQENGARIRIVRMDRLPPDGNWHPSALQATLFMGDFENHARRALRGDPPIAASTKAADRRHFRRDELNGRLQLFEVYFVQGVEYREAIRILQVPQGTFDYWFEEVKKICGHEFSAVNLLAAAGPQSASNPIRLDRQTTEG
jgi:hypothetical protein